MVKGSNASHGEIGASTVEGRDWKIKLVFWQYMFRTRLTLFGRMSKESNSGRCKRQLREYMGEMELSRG